MEIYIYTKTKWGLREWQGKMRGNSMGCRGGRVADHIGSRKYWTDLATTEGVVRGQSVWFTKPSLQKAIALLNHKSLDMAIDYMDKSTRAFQRARA